MALGTSILPHGFSGVVSKEHTFFGHLQPHSSGCRFAPGRSFYRYGSSLFRTLGVISENTKGWMIDKTWIHASWLICPTHLGTVASRDDMYLKGYGCRSALRRSSLNLSAHTIAHSGRTQKLLRQCYAGLRGLTETRIYGSWLTIPHTWKRQRFIGWSYCYGSHPKLREGVFSREIVGPLLRVEVRDC